MNRSIKQVLSGCTKEARSILTEEEGREVLTCLKIPVVPGGIASTAEEALLMAERVSYPVVMKVLSPDIPHKSDVGGVKLGLTCPDDVREAWDEIMDSATRAVPHARIQGMSVQKEAPDGIQIIAGALRDAHFGPVVMFGLGGIYTETFGDVAFRMAPLTDREAIDMVNSTAASRILAGLRGQKPADVDLVCRTLVALGQALVYEDRFREIEINPLVLWPGGGGVALDALITLE